MATISTRVYLPSTGAAPISPAYDAGWDDTSIATRLAAVTTKIGSAAANIGFADSDFSNLDILFQQWVIGPLAAQTISAQTVKIQMLCRETNTLNDMFLAWTVRVVSSDGSTVRGTIVGSPRRDATEMVSGTNTNRGDSLTSTSVAAQAGDYLVIEVGAGGDPVDGTVGHDSFIRIGDDSASDLPEDDSSTSTFNPWIEFANTITFAPAGTAHDAEASLSGVGAVAAVGLRGALGATALAGVGAVAAVGLLGHGGAVALSGIGSVSAEGLRGALGEAELAGIGTFTATPPSIQGAASLSGVGAISAVGLLGHGAAASLDGVGTVEAVGLLGHGASVSLVGIGVVAPFGSVGLSGSASLAGIGTLTAEAFLFEIFIPPPRIRPRLFIHDAATLRRLAQIVNVTSINRSHALREHIRSAEFDIALSDEHAWLTAPLSAHVVLIESNEYPHPWVGRIIERVTNHAERTFTVHADSYEAVLAERFLPSDFTTRRGAGGALRSILGQVNGQNATGIGLGHTDGLHVPPMTLSNARGIEALDKLAENAGAEWWLSYLYSQGEIEIFVNLAKERGSDFSQSVVLSQPGNFEVQSSRENGRAIAYAQTVVGGESSVLEAFTERERAVATRDAQFSRADAMTSQHVIEATRVFRHGHLLAGETSFRAPTQRREYLAVREELKQAGITPEVAEALLLRQRQPFRSVMGRVYPDTEGQPATSWKYLEPGNVVRLSSADAFGTGYDGPAVVVGVQPVEHERFMDLVIEVA